MLIEKRVRHLLHEYVQIFRYGSSLMKKYSKTGVRESTLLKSRFAKICTGCAMFDDNRFFDAACMLKLLVINPSYLKKLWVVVKLICL